MQTIWMWRERMEPPFSPWSTHAVTGEDGVLRLSKPSSGLSDVSIDPVASPVSDFRECANSPSSSLLLPPDELTSGPLYEMSSIMKQLPIKRGLSKHFEGKSQSFTSLSDVKCLEDLAKPDKSLKKKLKSSKSHRGELGNHRACFHKASSRTMSKKASKAFSSTDSKSNSGFFGCRLQIPSGGTRCHHTQTPLLNG